MGLPLDAIRRIQRWWRFNRLIRQYWNRIMNERRIRRNRLRGFMAAVIKFEPVFGYNLMTWLMDKAPPGTVICSGQDMLDVLYYCTCCHRHSRDKPESLNSTWSTRFNSSFGVGVRNYQCLCECRQLSRNLVTYWNRWCRTGTLCTCPVCA